MKRSSAELIKRLRKSSGSWRAGTTGDLGVEEAGVTEEGVATDPMVVFTTMITGTPLDPVVGVEGPHHHNSPWPLMSITPHNRLDQK